MNATVRWITRLIFILILVLVAAGIKLTGKKYFNSSADSSSGYVFDSFVMGTMLSVKIRGTDKARAELAAKNALEEVRRLNGIFDSHDPESEISRLNRKAEHGLTVSVSQDMAYVLSMALKIKGLSGGCFEPGLGEVIDLWGFSDRKSRHEIPDSSLVRAILEKPGDSATIEIDDDKKTIRLGPGYGALDVGGIAKGYAVDRAVDVLYKAGIRNALVNLGGEIGVLGVGSNGKSWRVGVQHPRKISSHLGVIEQVQGKFVATSGDYERFYLKNGKRYHHILDPFTGFPANSGVMGVTVIASSCLEADAYATAVFVKGPEEGISFLERLGVEGLVVYAPDGNSESGSLSWVATRGFSKIMNPDLNGLPII